MATDASNQEFVIDDPEELSQKKRVREILNRRTGVLDARDRARDEVALGGASEQQALMHYQSRIESLILDLWTKFESMDVDDGKEYLQSAEIDRVTVYPPEELDMGDDDFAAGVDQPEPKQVPIAGLQWFINNEPIVTAQFTAHTWNPPGKQTATNARYVPIRTLDKALINCLKFINESGIDADIEKDEQQTKIDRDLLEEVEEWRQQNVEE